MTHLKSFELKAFVPAKNFEISKRFYAALGFEQRSDTNGVAYFCHDNCSFLLQDFYHQEHAENFVMHLLVEDIYSWHAQFLKSGIFDEEESKLGDVIKQPWGMLDFTFTDPSGVLWRVGENV